MKSIRLLYIRMDIYFLLTMHGNEMCNRILYHISVLKEQPNTCQYKTRKVFIYYLLL